MNTDKLLFNSRISPDQVMENWAEIFESDAIPINVTNMEVNVWDALNEATLFITITWDD